MGYIGNKPTQNVVGGGDIVDGSIASADLADGAVTTAKIADANVTLAKLSATGTKDATTFLRGDNSFAVVSVTPTAVSDQTNSSTGFFDLPSGTTAQRPASPNSGMTRFNTDTGFSEFWTGSQWATYGNLSTASVSYLIVAGGGGSGRSETSDPAGGGGAGGYRTGTLGVTAGVSNTVTIGAGGLAGAFPNLQYQGGDSTFSSITSTGGGSGGNGSGSGNSTTTKNGTAGGSGGGSGYSNVGGAGVGGAGTAGQGYAGATNTSSVGGGGGGSSAAGSGQSGGAGTSNSISGSAITYSAGGAGASSSSGTGSAGAANTGNGAVAPWNNVGQNGGSGVVIISYANTYKDATATGTYTKTSSGGNTIYIFTGSGTITF